jgi:hypothetical protein
VPGFAWLVRAGLGLYCTLQPAYHRLSSEVGACTANVCLVVCICRLALLTCAISHVPSFSCQHHGALHSTVTPPDLANLPTILNGLCACACHNHYAHGFGIACVGDGPACSVFIRQPWVLLLLWLLMHCPAVVADALHCCGC